MAEIGDILKEARKNKGYTLDDLQQITKIQRRYLENIEDNDFSALPGDFYLRSFVEQYAIACDLDPKPLLASLKGEKVDLKVEKKAVDAVESIDYSRKNLRQDQHKSPKNKKNWPVIILTTLSLLIIMGVLVVTIKDRKNNPVISRPPAVIVNSTEESTVATSESVAESTVESTVESTTESSAAKSEFVIDSSTNSNINMTLKNVTDPVTFDFTGVNGPCWIGIIVNGNYIYQHTLQEAETVSTALPQGATSAKIVLGAAGNVTIKANGQEMKFSEETLGQVTRNLELNLQYQP